MKLTKRDCLRLEQMLNCAIDNVEALIDAQYCEAYKSANGTHKRRVPKDSKYLVRGLKRNINAWTQLISKLINEEKD